MLKYAYIFCAEKITIYQFRIQYLYFKMCIRIFSGIRIVYFADDRLRVSSLHSLGISKIRNHWAADFSSRCPVQGIDLCRAQRNIEIEGCFAQKIGVYAVDSTIQHSDTLLPKGGRAGKEETQRSRDLSQKERKKQMKMEWIKTDLLIKWQIDVTTW